MNIISVVGARPNFIKIAPIIQELNKHSNIFNHKLIHTTPKLWDGKSAERIVKVLIEKRDELQKDL